MCVNIICVCSENHVKHISVICRYSVEFPNLIVHKLTTKF